MQTAFYQQNKEDLTAITSLRGIAALLVCVLHFSDLLLPQFGTITAQYTNFFNNGYLWVDFFFLLSGFVLTHVYHQTFSVQISGHQYRKFMLARFARIYPLHLFMLLVLVLMEIVETIGYIQQHSLSHFLSVWPYGELDLSFTGPTGLVDLAKNIFLVHSLTISPLETSWNHPAWSIGTEWAAYFLIPLWIRLLYKRISFNTGLPVTLVVILGLCFATIVWVGGQTTRDLDVGGFIGLVRCTAEGIIGICFYTIYIRWLPTNLSINNFAFSLLFLCMALIMHWNIMDAAIIPVFALIILLINFHRGIYHRLLNASFLVYLGAISYSIYMIHIPFKSLINDISEFFIGMLPSQFFTVGESFLAMPLFLLIVIIISHFTYQYLEIPARNYIRRSIHVKRLLHT